MFNLKVNEMLYETNPQIVIIAADYTIKISKFFIHFILGISVTTNR